MNYWCTLMSQAKQLFVQKHYKIGCSAIETILTEVESWRVWSLFYPLLRSILLFMWLKAQQIDTVIAL